MNFFNKSITKRILGILLSATVVCSAMYGCSGGTSNDESSAKEAVASATSKPPVSSKVDKVESSKPVLSNLNLLLRNLLLRNLLSLPIQKQVLDTLK